jgi:hypothetical protein
MDMGIHKCQRMALQICLGNWHQGTPAFSTWFKAGHFEALQKGSAIHQLEGIGPWRSASFHDFTGKKCRIYIMPQKIKTILLGILNAICQYFLNLFYGLTINDYLSNMSTAA